MFGGDIVFNSYEINLDTLAIIPIDTHLSKIIETNQTFFVKKSTKDIVDDSCKFFGSSYVGRHEGTKNLIGISYKSPIVIEETENIIFFPTSSPRFNDCYWIALNKIKHYNKTQTTSEIIFNNDQSLIINISYGSLKNQILRATLLESTLIKRRKMKKNA